MKYWDITYITPAGIQGTHYAVQAESLTEAIRLTPEMLSYGTPWKPEQFIVVNGEPCEKPPLDSQVSIAQQDGFNE